MYIYTYIYIFRYVVVIISKIDLSFRAWALLPKKQAKKDLKKDLKDQGQLQFDSQLFFSFSGCQVIQKLIFWGMVKT